MAPNHVRRLMASLSSTVLALAGCSPASGEESSSIPSSPTGCPRSCVYDSRQVSVCNEGPPLGVVYHREMWATECQDFTECKPQFFSSDNTADPALPGCSGYAEFRGAQDYVGRCPGPWIGDGLIEGNAYKLDGAICGADGECVSLNCVSFDNSPFVCGRPCGTSGCATDFACVGGFCFPACLTQ
jgi:hypothetical protein